MKLNGITIESCEMFANEWSKPDFDGKEIWKSIKNGTLEAFEQNVVKQNSGLNANKKVHQLAMELVFSLGNAFVEDADIPFVQDGKLDGEILNKKLEPFSANNSLGKDLLDFFGRNTAALDRLYDACGEEWTSLQANILYVFLLLQLQILPKKAIRERDVDFLIELLQAQKPAKVEHRAPNRLCLTEDMILRCIGKEIQCYDLTKRSGWNSIHRSKEEIHGIAYSEEVGLIAFTKSGRLSAKTSLKIRSEVGEKRIVMASAYGRQYVLLAEDGSVISNLPLAEDAAWKDVSWVCAGLNSAAGISGQLNNAITYGLDWNADHTDVRTVVTRSTNGKSSYAVLKNDGTLLFDFGSSVEAVAAVCMGTRGYVYIKDGEVYVRAYTGGPDRLAAKLPAEASVEELHSVEDYFLCGTAEKPYLGVLR